MASAHLQDRQQQSLRAFQHDLAKLWAVHPGQWVAYQGDLQIGLAAHKHELYQDCFRRGLQRDEFVIFCIEPQETEMTLGPIVLD